MSSTPCSIRGRQCALWCAHAAAAPALREAGVEVLIGDVCEPSLLAEAVRGVDVVYHCATAVGPAFSPRKFTTSDCPERVMC